MAKIYIDKVRKEGGRFHLWMHSKDLNEYDLWNDLKEILKLLKGL